MAIVDKKGGKLPAYMGDWSETYNDGHGYMVKNRVTIFGSELESLIDNNTYVPATRNEQTGVVTFDEHWKVISNGSQAYAAALAATNKMAELEEEWDDQDQRMTQMQATINAKQLEVGAVQTDEVPTENSGNHMTSGDIYQTLKNSAKGFVDNEPTAGSDNLVKSKGIQKELALGAVYDVSAKNPTAGPNSDGKWESLSALLSDNNLNTLIPTSVRKGGMSIKYVQSSDNKYVQFFCTADEFTTDVTKWAIDDVGVYVENPEFVYIQTDSEDKILFAIKTDGSIFFGEGVPTQVREYIENLWSTYRIEDISNFIGELLDGTYNLSELLNLKVDKEAGKSLIDSNVASNTSYDSTNNVIQTSKPVEVNGGAEIGGNTTISGDATILGKVDIQGATYTLQENPEWIKVLTDAQDRIIAGIRKDGSVYIGELEIPASLQLVIDALTAENASLNERLQALESIISTTQSPEFIDVKVDAEGKVLSGRRTDGTKFETLDLEVQKKLSAKSLVVAGTDITDNIEAIAGNTYVEDPENRIEVKTDGEGKVVSYRDNNGVLKEIVGIKTPNVNTDEAVIGKKLSLSEEAKAQLLESLNLGVHKAPNIPKYGTSNIKTEIFYLTADARVSSANDVVLMQDFEDSAQNARDRMTICHYYIKETLTNNGDGTYSINQNSVRLQHYASGKVKLNSSDNKYYAKETIRKIGGVCYYADTLGYTNQYGMGVRNKVLAGYTRVAEDIPSLEEGGVEQINVEVTEITAPVCVNAWTIEDWDFNAVAGTDIGKKYGHKCICDVDFAPYYSKNNVAIEVKHQGNSTQGNRKRNYRYTFYKKNDFAKKDKIKIGEMLRLSGYNLKANYSDLTRIKECVLYRLFVDIWNTRPITDRFEWDNLINGYYHGATGHIVGFPMELSVNGEFYGIYIFGLKKDEKNYMLDGEDESGFLISGSTATWGDSDTNFSPEDVRNSFDEEMLDEMSNSTALAVSNWHEFIHNRLYVGSDGNDYSVELLTDIDGTMYVTSTLEEGQPVASSISAEPVEFDKQNIPYRMDLQGFIDYFICLQLFMMRDNCHNNIMLYSNAEKKKLYPFFYDLDLSMLLAYNLDLLDPNTQSTVEGDKSLWRDFRDIYWDEIVNRYSELRKTILTTANITTIFQEVYNNIPQSDYNKENEKWDVVTTDYSELVQWLVGRFKFLDNTYFIY